MKSRLKAFIRRKSHIVYKVDKTSFATDIKTVVVIKNVMSLIISQKIILQ